MVSLPRNQVVTLRGISTKATIPELGKIDKTRKVNKDYDRPYITYLRDKVTSKPRKRGFFYSDQTAYKFLGQLT
jgi:hypothetical protein